MKDRELLEKAAKAAGMETRWDQPRGAKTGVLRARYPGSGDAFPYWQPLDDDGAALRLACALRINIEHTETLSRKPHGVNCWPVGRGDCGHMENDLADYGAATRRAIVRAAAAMVDAPAVLVLHNSRLSVAGTASA